VLFGLRRRLGSNLRALRSALLPMRERGFGRLQAVLWQLPAALTLRAWRALAQPVNAALLRSSWRQARFAAFRSGLAPDSRPRLYVIVMPQTLHFLHPCLSLLQGQAQLVLIANGAKAWELAWLARRFAGMPVHVLPTLPASSAPHGAVVSLLLSGEERDFGIVDHDAYVFDDQLLHHMKPGDRDSMVGCFEARSEATGLAYPLTHLLFLNTAALRGVMERWRIDARLYRRAPQQVVAPLAQLGLGRRSYLKPYQGFFDTLHVLLAVAQVEGLSPRFEAAGEAAPVWHVGGTSIGSHHTKNLFALYLHLRFLELLGDAEVSRRYAALTAPLQCSDDALRRAAAGDPAWQGLPLAQALLQRLHDATNPSTGIPA